MVLAGASPLGWGRAMVAATLGLLPTCVLYALVGATAIGLREGAITFVLTIAIAGLSGCWHDGLARTVRRHSSTSVWHPGTRRGRGRPREAAPSRGLSGSCSAASRRRASSCRGGSPRSRRRRRRVEHVLDALGDLAGQPLLDLEAAREDVDQRGAACSARRPCRAAGSRRGPGRRTAAGGARRGCTPRCRGRAPCSSYSTSNRASPTTSRGRADSPGSGLQALADPARRIEQAIPLRVLADPDQQVTSRPSSERLRGGSVDRADGRRGGRSAGRSSGGQSCRAPRRCRPARLVFPLGI